MSGDCRYFEFRIVGQFDDQVVIRYHAGSEVIYLGTVMFIDDCGHYRPEIKQLFLSTLATAGWPWVKENESEELLRYQSLVASLRKPGEDVDV